MLITLLLTVLILVICAMLLGIKIIFVKGGQFPNTHVGGNKALAEKGIHCHTSQDKEAENNKNLFERLEEIKKQYKDFKLHFMKNINYIINGVLALAVVILFVLQFTGKKESGVTKTFTAEESASGLLPIAYVNVDSLLLNYNYSKDLNEIIIKKQENSRASVNQKLRSLQTEMQDFQRKVENNAFLTRERAEQEQARLMKKQQELQDFDNRLAQELVSEQQRLNEQLRDTLVSQLRVYNKDKGYQVILSNTMGDNILLAGDAYDITKEVIEYLNKNYAPASK